MHPIFIFGRLNYITSYRLMKYSSVFILISFLFACSPQVTEPVVSEPAPVQQVRKEIDNPCMTLGKLSPQERDEAETAYTLYRDQVKLKYYEDALPLWRKAFEMAPAGEGRIKYQFDDGIKLYKHFFAQTEDPALKKIYADSIIIIYNKRVECHPGDADYVNARLGFDSYYTLGGYVGESEAFDRMKKAFDSKGTEVDYFVINPFTKLVYDNVVAEKMSHEEGRKYAHLIFGAIEKGLDDCGNSCESWETINDYAPQRLEALEGLKGFYGCDYYARKYVPEYKANAEDCETIANITRKLKWGDCPPDHPNVMELVAAKSQNCYVAPPPEGPLKLAFNAYNEGQLQEAILLFQAFVDKTDDIDKKAKYTLLIAKIYYGDIKNFPQSRKYALKAAELRSNWGEPYLLIGKLYASSGPLCGPGRGWDSQIVTWPAIDKFQKAKQVDPSIAEEANKWINQYTQYMPKKEDIFQRSISKGDSFTVGCWIQERTRVRTSD